MKKLLLAFFLFGSFSVTYAIEIQKLENTSEGQDEKKIYFPVRIVSSCGYTEFIEFTPGYDDPTCIETELRRMEEFCDAPVDGWGFA